MLNLKELLNPDSFLFIQDPTSKRYGDDEEELDKISKGYEEIRRMVDNQRINQVNFKM